ncbi:hypothetical protein Taro_029685 [Colocasia esculenta]|uniref:Uncharacterized protein n=1 Tax=Colocasia esculenta TaxID=4460 RepID=A0A843VRV5_COLES|nr:hypothetical protein [Colocasia esculenta]
MKGPAAAPLKQDKKLWRPTNTTPADHTAAGPRLAPLGTLARPDVQLYTRVRVSSKTTQTSTVHKYKDKPRVLTCLAHTKPGAPN